MNYLQRVIRTNQFPASAVVSSHKSLIKKGIGIGLLIIVIIFILSLLMCPQTQVWYLVAVYRNETVSTSYTPQLLSPFPPNNFLQDKIVGEFPNGTVVVATHLYNYVGHDNLVFLDVFNTTGVTFESSDPPLPIIAPNVGSQIVYLSFDVPKGYVGDLNYILYCGW